MMMAYLNKELQDRLNQLSSTNKQLLEQFLFDISTAKRDTEKQDAVRKLRSKIREIVAREEQ